MHDPAAELAQTPDRRLTTVRTPELPTLPAATPELRDLFRFMSDAELRFESLRMQIVDRQVTTHGDEVVTHDIWLRHPNLAKIVSTRGASSDGDYDVWLGNGETVRTYSALAGTVTERRAPSAPRGAADPDLPPASRVYIPQTALQAESLADTFVHPHGFCRNVLSSGAVTLRGTATVGGRETLLLRCDHPRISHVLLDRPDHWLEVGVDVQTGVLLLLAEHIGERMTRHAQAGSVRLDESIPDAAFTLHTSADARRIY